MNRPANSSTSGRRGFTLVEVVIAMAIATVAIVSALGMIRVGMDSEGDSGRDTIIVPMVQHIMTEFRSVPFDALWAAEPSGARQAGPSTAAPVESRFYFTMEGVPIPLAEVQGNFDAYYECVVTKVPDPLTQSVATTSGTAVPGRYNQLKLQMQFSWPLNVPPANRSQNQKQIYASVSRY